MLADISFYLDGKVEERLPQLTTPESPLSVNRQLAGFYILHSNNPILDHFFTFDKPDFSMMGEDPLHLEAQKILDFRPGSNLYYNRCILNSDKAAIFKLIGDHMTKQGIPFYMTAIEEPSGKESLIHGYNPTTNTEIHNPNLRQDLSRFLK